MDISYAENYYMGKNREKSFCLKVFFFVKMSKIGWFFFSFSDKNLKKKKGKKGEFTEEPDEIYDGVEKEASPLRRLFRDYYDHKCFLIGAILAAIAGAVCTDQFFFIETFCPKFVAGNRHFQDSQLHSKKF